MARVELEHLSKVFQGPDGQSIRAVENVGLLVAKGELLVLVGPSGCGKTTLLRLVAGLEEPTTGIIRIEGQEANGLSPKERDVAMVFQSPALYPHLTVYDNLAFGLKLRGLPKPDRQERVREAADWLGLTHCLDRRPMEISGGERQRVALGRALVRRPKVILLDEPLSNLDAPLRGRMRLELVRLQQRLDATMIYVTHDQAEAMALGTRLAVMRAGALQQVGAPGEVYERPANMFVAGFLGAPPMNFLPGQLVAGDKALVFKLSGSGAALTVKTGEPQAKELGRYAGQTVVLGLRPQAAVQTSGADATAEGVVELTERAGPDLFAHLKSEGQELAVQIQARREVRVGERIRVRFDLNLAVWFEPESGRRIGG